MASRARESCRAADAPGASSSIDSTVDSIHSLFDRGAHSLRTGLHDVNHCPVDQCGATMHLGTKKGEVANRVLSVGSMDRALVAAALLDAAPPLFQHLSRRGFLTVTGCYRGVPVSIVTTNMGMANMDFVVRECRAVVDGHMAVVRLGTCGALRPPARLGTLAVASPGAVCVRRDPDAFTAADGRPAYSVSLPVAGDAALTAALAAAAARAAGEDGVACGMDASADSFYSSQGRTTDDFEDGNAGLLEQLLGSHHPPVLTLEMESFQLLDLARCSRGGGVRAAACAIVIAERYSNRFIDADLMALRERQGVQAALEALVATELHDDASLLNGRSGFAPPPGGYVWQRQADEAAAAGAAATAVTTRGEG